MLRQRVVAAEGPEEPVLLLAFLRTGPDMRLQRFIADDHIIFLCKAF